MLMPPQPRAGRASKSPARRDVGVRSARICQRCRPGKNRAALLCSRSTCRFPTARASPNHHHEATPTRPFGPARRGSTTHRRLARPATWPSPLGLSPSPPLPVGTTVIAPEGLPGPQKQLVVEEHRLLECRQVETARESEVERGRHGTILIRLGQVRPDRAPSGHCWAQQSPIAGLGVGRAECPSYLCRARLPGAARSFSVSSVAEQIAGFPSDCCFRSQQARRQLGPGK
jgi:hypothetical protein